MAGGHLNMSGTSTLLTDLSQVTPERDIARDLARRAVWVAPAFVAVGAIGWGATGAASAAIALVLVVANFLIGAAIITRAVSISSVVQPTDQMSPFFRVSNDGPVSGSSL